MKRRFMLKSYTDCLFNEKIIQKSQQRLKSDHHDVYIEKINKTALNSNDDKILQTLDKITTYSRGTNAFKTCESEMLMVMKYKDFVLIDENHIKEKNGIFKVIFAMCILNRLIRFRKGRCLWL